MYVFELSGEQLEVSDRCPVSRFCLINYCLYFGILNSQSHANLLHPFHSPTASLPEVNSASAVPSRDGAATRVSAAVPAPQLVPQSVRCAGACASIRGRFATGPEFLAQQHPPYTFHVDQLGIPNTVDLLGY